MERSTVTLNLLIFLFFGFLVGALAPFYIQLFGLDFASKLQFLLFFSASLILGTGLGLLAFIINKITIVRTIYTVATELKEMVNDEGVDLTQSIGVASQDELGFFSYWFNSFVKHLDEKISYTKQLASAIRENGVELNIDLHQSADVMRTVSNNLNSVEKLSKEQGNLLSDAGEQFQHLTESFSQIAENSGVLIDNFKDFTYYIQKQNTLTQDFFNSIESLKHSLGDQNSGKVKDQLHNDLLGITIQFSKESTRSIYEQMQRFTRIEKLLEEIEDIAESTHLLSINASIEAARAGETGRGFTIVALQIRNLATNSGTLTSEIREQIEAIMSMAKNSSAQLSDLQGILDNRMEDVISDIQLLNGCAGDIGKTVERIASIQRKLKEKVEDIDQEFGATNETRETLLQSMGQLGDSSQKLNQSVDQLSAGSGQIEQITQDFLSQGVLIERQTTELLESVRDYQVSETPEKLPTPEEKEEEKEEQKEKEEQEEKNIAIEKLDLQKQEILEKEKVEEEVD